MGNSFEDRERALETKFLHDQETAFKTHAHRNKLFAAWVADQMGDGAPPHYTETLLEFALGRAPDDMIAKALQDLHNHGVALADIKIRKALAQCEDQARLEM